MAARALVVGAGVAGAATALELARAGFAVTLLEAERPAFGASGRNPGFLFLLGKQAGLPLEVAQAGRDHQAALAGELGDFAFRPCGLLAFVRDERALPSLAAFAAQRSAAGLQVALLDREEVLRRVPALDPDVAGGLFSEREAQQDTALLVERLVEAATEAGVLLERAHVAALTVQGGRCGAVRLEDGGTLGGDLVVLCNGPDGPRLLAPLGLKLPLTPVRYQAADTAPAPFRLPCLLAGPGLFGHLPLLTGQPDYEPAAFAEPRLPLPAGMSYTHQIAQRPDGRLLFGCAAESGVTDAHATVAGQAPALETLARDLPAARRLAVERSWAGIVAQAPDYLPVIDPSPGVDGLALNLGHAFGNLVGALSGRMLAAAVTGARPPFPLEPFALSRFG